MPAHRRGRKFPDGGGAETRWWSGTAIVAWEGIGDVDGNPIDPSPEAVTELMNIWPICRAFNKQVVEPAFDQESEKKDCAPSPSGSSAAARDTAKDAGNSAPNAPDS